MGGDVIDTRVSDIDVTDDAVLVTNEVDATKDTAFITTTDVFSPLVSFCN